MKPAFALALVTLAFAFAAPAHAGRPPSRAEVLLTLASTPEELRARLSAYADSARASDAFGAAEALYYAGMSHDRAGARDSAIACYRRAVDLRGAYLERSALADALLLRQGPGDAAAARAAVEPALGWRSGPVASAQELTAGRVAWAQFVDGDTAHAVERFAAVQTALCRWPQWARRMAAARLARDVADDPDVAYRLLFPLAVQSRKQDADVMQLIEDAAGRLGARSHLEPAIDRDIVARDVAERTLLRTLGGARVRFAADDGSMLGGVAIGPWNTTRPRAAVVVTVPGDTVAAYDSLVVALTREGFAVLLLDPRGSGWSVNAACPLPDAWAGREAELHTLVAQDVRAAVGQLLRFGAVDTTRLLLAGVGPTASIVVEAAASDRRVKALLLVSPSPAPVDRGPMRARIASLQLPVYLQIAPEDFGGGTYELSEALYQAGNRPASRVADSGAPGRGAAILRANPQIVTRFTRWLDEVWPHPAGPRVLPRATRRKG